MPDLDSVKSLDAQLEDLRSNISDLGYQVDSSKTKTAAALGTGVFLLLLAVGAVYDLAVGKGGVWLRLGITHEALIWITVVLATSATILLTLGFRRVSHLDINGAKARLEQMEQEYSDMVERRDGDATKRL